MSKEIEKMTAIYEKHKNTMYAVALKILKNPQDAEDAVHNTIPPIMRNLDAIKDVDSKDCIYYVTMAVKHMSFNMIRDRHIQTVSLSDIEYEFASDENIAESVIIDESCKIIYQNIKSMPGRISGCANPPFVLRIIHIADFGFSEQKARHRKITTHSWKKAAESSIKGGWI